MVASASIAAVPVRTKREQNRARKSSWLDRVVEREIGRALPAQIHLAVEWTPGGSAVDGRWAATTGRFRNSGGRGSRGLTVHGHSLGLAAGQPGSVPES